MGTDPVHRDAADLDLPHGADRRRVRSRPQQLRGRCGHDPDGASLPAVPGRAPRRRASLRHHRRGIRHVRRALRLPLPVWKVRPDLRPGVQRRGDGEHRLRDISGRIHLPQQGRRRDRRIPPRHDAARALTHVVRRSGHDALVGRPLAEGVLRDLGLDLRRQPARSRSERPVGGIHQQLQDHGLSPGSTPLDPPDRRRHRRPGGGGVQLRPDHLRQGRVGADPAGGLRRARSLSGRGPGLLPRPRVRQHHARRSAAEPGTDLGPGSVRLVAAVAGNRRGQHPPARPRGRRRRIDQLGDTAPGGAGGPADAAPAPDRVRRLRAAGRQARPSPADRTRRRRSADADR